MSTHFAELRSLLNAAPSPASWERICRILEEAPWPQAQQELLPYASAHLERWPDALRVMPARWLAPRAPQSEISCLARALTFRGPRLTIQDAQRMLANQLPTHISQLTLSNLSCEERALEALFKPHLWPKLRVLNLARSSLSAHNVHAIAAHPLSQRLISLDLRGAGLGAKGLELLAQGQQLEALAHLNLAANRLSERDLEGLFAAQSLPQLQHLDLSDNALTQAPLAPLINQQRHMQLTTLRIGGPINMSATLDALKRHAWTGLERLCLSHAQLDSATFTRLLNSPSLAGLRALELVLVSLQDYSFLTQPGHPLAELKLHRARLDKEAMAALSGPRWAALQRLDLSGCAFDEAALMAWTQRRPHAQLERLSLASTSTHDQALRALLRAGHLDHIIALDLSNTKISDELIAEFAASPILGNLQELKLGGTLITDAGKRALKRSPHLHDALKASL